MSDTQTTNKFFTAGGTLSLNAPYVIRPTDEQLHRAILSAEYCNVLAPRQMGKSSLMVRTVTRLKEQGVRTATIDLTDIGTKLNPDEWFFGLISRLKTQLDLKLDERTWWDAHVYEGTVQRFSDFIRDVVLEQISDQPIVIFIDEIDSTLSMPFTDDFFAAVRAAYNARANEPVYKRLTFVLMGVARASDLIKDRSRTPYNIGRSIDLEDFTLQEAVAFLPGLESTSPQHAKEMLERILYWTGGHPYLTQKVCAQIILNSNGSWTSESIDALIKRIFLSDESRKESNLQYIGDRIRESRDRERLLRTYRKVLSSSTVEDEERDPIKSQLKLAGIVKATSKGMLMVRNRVYEAVFNEAWINQTMPKLTSRRIIIGSILFALVAVVATAIVLINQQSGDEIRAQTFVDGFHQAQSPLVQISNLAGLFNLGDGRKFASSAYTLFFDELTPDEQLAMFANLNSPEQVGRDMQTVIDYLSKAVQFLNSPQNNLLLNSMTIKLGEIENAFPDSRILRVGLESWLEGRTQFLAGEYETSMTSYTDALSFNDQNPVIYFDRAISYTRLGQNQMALQDLAQIIQLDPERSPQVAGLILSEAVLQEYLKSHSGEFPTLISFAP